MSEYGRFFTATRHVPMTFGVNPATGERLPGGPYTSAQVFGALGVGALMWVTSSLWGTGTLLADLLFGVAVMAGVGWFLRYMPDDLSDYLTLGIGASKMLDKPRSGVYEGKPWRLKTRKIPTHLQHIPATSETTEHDADGDEERTQVEAEHTTPRHLGTSSIDRILAHSTTEETPR